MKKTSSSTLSLSLSLFLFLRPTSIVRIKRKELFQERMEQKKKNFQITYFSIVKKRTTEPRLDIRYKYSKSRPLDTFLPLFYIINTHASKLSSSTKKKKIPKIPLSRLKPDFESTILAIRSLSFLPFLPVARAKRKMEARARAHKSHATMLPRLQFTPDERVEFISKMLGERSCDVSRLH